MTKRYIAALQRAAPTSPMVAPPASLPRLSIAAEPAVRGLRIRLLKAGMAKKPVQKKPGPMFILGDFPAHRHAGPRTRDDHLPR